MNSKLKRKLILNVPYAVLGLFATNLGEAWKLATGTNVSEKLQSLILDGCFKEAFCWGCCSRDTSPDSLSQG